MNILPRTVRGRLTLWYTTALAFVLIAFSLGVSTYARRSLTQQSLLALDRDRQSIENLLRHDPSELDELEEHDVVSFFRVDEGDKTLFVTSAWGRLGFDAVMSRTTSGDSTDMVTVGGRRFRVSRTNLADAGKSYRVAVAVDDEATQHAQDELVRAIVIGLPIALMLCGLGGYILAGRMLAPVGAMADKARQITADRLSERLPVEPTDSEFASLASVFNDTLARLDSAFQRLRRFTSDASHEFRTPLTAMRSVGEVALRERRDAEGYRDVIGSMLEEVDRLTRLVDCLLMLTRADSQAAALNREEVKLADLVRECIEHLRPLAEEKGQSLESNGASETSMVSVDPVLLRHAVINLIDNAIKYSPRGGHIIVDLSHRSDGSRVINVSDSGPGIVPDEQERVFERFYRVDKARSRENGGAGLGLSIAQWAITIHGGRIELESKENLGSTFRIILPPQVNSTDDAQNS